MLSKISQAEEDKYCMISLIYGILRRKKKEAHGYREQIGGCQKQRWRWGVEIGEGDQMIQTSSYKTNKSWGHSIQYGNYSY